MEKKLIYRIDDRLIHGQITTSWTNYLDVERILVVDDSIAKNPMLANIVTMGAPAQYKAKVITLEQAHEKIKKKSEKFNTLVIFRFPHMITDLVFDDVMITDIIIGTVIKNANSIKQMNQNVFLTEADVKALDFAKQRNIRVRIQMLPDTQAIHW